MESAKLIISQEGYAGLFGRGLKTRILANGIQGAMFTILWRAFADMLEKQSYPSLDTLSVSGSLVTASHTK